MIENWFKPLGEKDIPGIQSLRPGTFGREANIHRGDPPKLKEVSVALVGIGAREANDIRRYLYPLAYSFSGLKVADLGNARRKTDSFLIQAVKELLDSNIVPILLGSDPATTLAQAKAFLRLRSHISLAVADEKPPLSPSGDNDPGQYLDELIHGKNGPLFHLGLLGLQGHFIKPDTFNFLDQCNFDTYRLGQARDGMEGLEPVLRDADLVSFNLSCVKESEADEVNDPSPSGFTTEEACRLSRYAGMSDKLRSFGLYGYQRQKGSAGKTARVAAQLIWYFLDGFYNRKHDFPVSMDAMVEYIVDVPSAGHQIVFWKSNKSGRWWMQIPVTVDKDRERHRLVPCTFQDYQTACQDDLPDRLLHALNRFA